MSYDQLLCTRVKEQFYASTFLLISSQNSDLVWICVKVKVFQEACSKLAEQEVVCLIDSPHAPVCVVVGTGAGAERSHCKQSMVRCKSRQELKKCVCVWVWARSCHTGPVGGSVPVLVIMREAGEAWHAACVIVTQALQHLPELLPALLLHR